MLLTKPVHDACLVEIVGGYLKFDEIARGKADEPLPHLSRDVGEYEMFISKRDPETWFRAARRQSFLRFQSDAPLAIRGALSALTIHPAKSQLTILRATNKNERAIDFVFIAQKASESLPNNDMSDRFQSLSGKVTFWLRAA
jgi:hypothetical protein